MLHVQRHGKLERAQGPQARPVAVLDDKTLRRRVVEIANRYECECAVCDVIKKPNTQGGRVSSAQMARTCFQR